MQSNNTRVVPSLPFDEARALVETAELEFDRLMDLHYEDKPNSPEARLKSQRAVHNRKLAEINATLAVADELRQIRGLLTAYLTECTQVIL